MKKILSTTLIVLVTVSLSLSQISWQIVDPPIVEDFVSLCFTDPDHGWIISETGTVLSTEDAGVSWLTSNMPNVYYSSIHFSDNEHGCIVGWVESLADSSLIMITNDGGDTWSMVDHIKVNRLNDVFFINNNIGWAVGSYTYDGLILNRCLYTSDGGASWAYQSSITQVGAILSGVSFRDENLGSTCGADGAFFVTNNGGVQSWAFGISMPIVNLNAIYNWGALTGCIVGDNGTALYTINNWYQYIETVTNTTENLNGVSADQATNKLWAVGDNGTIIYSSSYILGWITQASGVTENLNDIQMINETNGWAVGENGTILHFFPATSINQNDEPQIEVYPNPVDDVLYIYLDNRYDFRQIQLYNSTGKLIHKNNIDSHLEILVDVSKYPPGIYYFTIIGESAIVNKKLLIR